MANLVGSSNDPNVAAVFGEHTAGQAAVIGQSANGRGLLGVSEAGQGVWGHSVSSAGVVGVTKTGWAVQGESETGYGVVGISQQSAGVRGTSSAGRGTEGVSADSEGVVGFSTNGNGVLGQADGAGTGLVGTSRSGIGVFGQGDPAGFFKGKVFVDGNIEVTGDLLLAGADYAEGLTAADPTLPPGTVVVVGEDGRVHPCRDEYDSTVAGVVSGGGGVRPAVVLDRHDEAVPVALVGKVWCFADAAAAPIRPGDLLTTSATSGHAQRVTERERAFGAVIGKALTALAEGRGMVRVLVSPR